VEGLAGAPYHDSQDHTAEQADHHPGQGQLHDLSAAEARPSRGERLLRRLRAGGLCAAGRHQPMSETPYLMTLYMIAVRYPIPPSTRTTVKIQCGRIFFGSLMLLTAASVRQ
jgi:hypothetical protein